VLKQLFILTFSLACGYFVTGFFSNYILGIDGYAVASWPPSGIALGGILIWGRRAILGIVIGALLTNLLHLENLADIFQTSILFQALGVTLAATFQACLGAFFILRVIKSPLDLSSLKHSIQSLLVAGPLCCVIAATAGTSLLVINNVISQASAFDSFIMWWVGDSIGVLIFTPLMLAAFKYEKIHNKLQVIIPSLLIYLLINISFYGVASLKKEKDLQKKEAKVLVVQAQIKDTLDEIKTHLALLAAFFSSSKSVNYSEFKQFTSMQLYYSKEIVAFEWVPYVNKNALNDVNVFSGLNLAGDYYIKEKNILGEWQPVAKRDFYFPVQYANPLQGIESIIGFDLASNITRRSAILKAKKLNGLVLSKPIELAQSKDKTGVLFMYPVFASSPNKVGFKGFVVAVVSAEKLSQFLYLHENTNVIVSIFDVTNKGEPQAVYLTSNNDRVLLKSYEQVIGERIWQIDLYEPLVSGEWFAYWITQIVGMLFVWLLITFLISVTGTNIRIREQVAKQTHSLRLEKQKSDEASKTKSQFLANMSHEVRTPINGIKGLHYLALQQEDWQQAKAYIEQADGALSVLLRVLNDVLDFSKMEAGKLALIQEPINLSHLTQEIMNLVQFDIDIKSLNLCFDNDNPEETIIYTDSIRLKQVLLNLLNNAIKFTSEGTITLKVWQSKRMTYFSVTDTGIGIEDKAQALLFRPFSQEDSSTSRQYGGTGLGLSICKKLVELMGGGIDLVSHKGKGSTFTFSLPITSALPKAEQVETHFQNIDINHISLAAYKVLLVEDNPLNQHVASAILKTKSCTADIANDGLEAIEKLTTEHYDIVLMDIQMPNMDGLKATRVIRGELELTDLPIIGLSANAHDEDIEKALDSGMDSYITKPIDANILFRTLWYYLSIKKQTYDR
jgi:signal transduction histidine kinase/ActR/RegA family two-component response regulator